MTGIIQKIRILVADDHALVREGICLLLRGFHDMEVVGECADGAQAVQLVENLRPDVVLMDISMPVMGGIDAIQLIKQNSSSVQILALTVHESPEYLRKILSFGAAGYLLKGTNSVELASAVRAIYARGMYLDPKVTRRLVDEFVPRENSHDGRDGRDGKAAAYGELSRREREVLRHVAEGQTNLEIGKMLYLSPNTVQTYRSRIMEKLGLHNRSDLIKYALRAGVLDNG